LFDNKYLEASYDGLVIISWFGVLSLREVDCHIALTKRVPNTIYDTRDQRYVKRILTGPWEGTQTQRYPSDGQIWQTPQPIVCRRARTTLLPERKDPRTWSLYQSIIISAPLKQLMNPADIGMERLG